MADELKNIVEETKGEDIIKVVEVKGTRNGKSFPLKTFFETEEVQALLNAKNCKSLLIYFEDKNETNPPAISMSTGAIEYIGQLLVPLVRSCLEHDPAKIIILPNVLIDVILKTVQDHFKSINFPVTDEDLRNKYLEKLQNIHSILREILYENNVGYFIDEWVRIMIDTANDETPEIRDKVLDEINKTFSYMLYKSRHESDNIKGN